MRVGGKTSGDRGETLAAGHLEKNGFKIVERNWRCKGGEIDIIALDGMTLVFVEVKARGDSSLGTPFEAVDFRKVARLEHAARLFIASKKLEDVCVRFDVVGVSLDTVPPRLELIRDAFHPASAW